MLKTFPQLSPTTVPPGTYKGQTAEIRSVSAWNFVVANKDLANQTAYAITKAVLSAADPKSEICPTAAGTLAGNAAYNRIMPFHPDAMQFYAEAGIQAPLAVKLEEARSLVYAEAGIQAPLAVKLEEARSLAPLQLIIAIALAARAPENEHTIAASP
jgi:NMT1-like family